MQKLGLLLLAAGAVVILGYFIWLFRKLSG